MKTVMYSLFDHPLLKKIAHDLSISVGKCEFRHFPDEETYLRIDDDLKDANVILIDSLDRPDKKIVPLLFFSKTAKKMGATRVILCAPYLAYMRQDKQFHPGESESARYFAELLSSHFDGLITIEPHLHRLLHLEEIYTIPTKLLHATRVVSFWIKENVVNPLLIGPDQESEQWVSAIAVIANAPYIILEKIRHGDKDVEVSVPDIQKYQHCVPVLIDDIISTGQTMIKTIQQLKKVKMKSPICIGVHAIFSDDAYPELLKAGAEKVITCNTIPHETNAIDVSKIVNLGLDYLLK